MRHPLSPALVKRKEKSNPFGPRRWNECTELPGQCQAPEEPGVTQMCWKRALKLLTLYLIALSSPIMQVWSSQCLEKYHKVASDVIHCTLSSESSPFDAWVSMNQEGAAVSGYWFSRQGLVLFCVGCSDCDAVTLTLIVCFLLSDCCLTLMRAADMPKAANSLRKRCAWEQLRLSHFLMWGLRAASAL